MDNPVPTKIHLHRQSQILEVTFDKNIYSLSAEYLRVFSPSAEVKGHGPEQEVLQLNKSDIAITDLETQGNYAIKIVFSDGHNSGIYAWSYLRELGENHTLNWQSYMRKVEEYEATKDISVVKLVDPK